MEYVAYILAMLIGISLGLIGAGGSILTVPVLVYLFNVDPVSATAYSLFVVGTTALVGGIQSFIKGRVDLRTALLFGAPSIASVYLSRRFIMPSIPKQIDLFGAFSIEKGTALLIIFAVLMIVTSVTMIRDSGIEKEGKGGEGGKFRVGFIVLEGIVVGVVTGLMGAGGGFLIIPALVLFAGLDMKIAVGTSLFIIAAKSLIGFIGDLQTGRLIDWQFLLLFTGFSIVGIFVGIKLGQRVDGRRLKKGFGWFVLIMGIYMIIRELL